MPHTIAEIPDPSHALSTEKVPIRTSLQKIWPISSTDRNFTSPTLRATMKLNATTALSTPSILLVPYTPSHVPTYHTWMLSPALRSATASEPLSLSEEYAMQQSWRSDGDKLTFIICLPLPPGRVVEAGVADAPERMVGDINLFLTEDDEDEYDVSVKGWRVVGEIELMIAEQKQQRKGYGRAAVIAFLEYILVHWRGIADEYQSSLPAEKETKEAVPQLAFLRVKVQQTNVGSLRLFEGVGFQQIAEEANYFGEVEMRWQPDLEDLRRLKGWEAGEERVFMERENGAQET
ncbi:hypothetical protein TI39_contig289g00030 [Zymoseptoria brevis]|uniref:N-acetyltransferase domain-containing protein n=1 Tax=Zymoseptoria brevis TaxID=1047168 RepID=A0A0F4GWV9_9PEZI|nr:hypothetical protein TI39_contig289g00030 [Zymoseptoria brevis]